YFLLDPYYSLSVAGAANLFGLTVFAVMGCVISGLMEMLHRSRAPAGALSRQAAAERGQLRVTPGSIGDAVLAPRDAGRVTFLNPVAEALTGWKQAEAAGRPLEQVFRIVNELTGVAVEGPVARVLREGKVVGLANHTALISKDGTMTAIEDSAAPIL